MQDIVCISPIDGKVLSSRAYTSAAELEGLLSKARKAQVEWEACGLEVRKTCILRFLSALERLDAELVPELAQQMGRPICFGGELRSVRERINVLVALADEGLRTYSPPQEPKVVRKIKRRAKGVVLAIIPWNYPYLAVVNPVIPALLAGNSVVMKHSAQTILVADRIVEAFRAAGLPDGVFSSVQVSHATTETLISSRQFDHVSFTGSVRGGAEIAKAAAAAFVTTTLELGGKDPAYVRPDADLSAAAPMLAEGGFFNSGQCCCGVERVYVHDTVYDEFIERMAAEAKALKLGNPLDLQTTLGPMASARYANMVRDQIEEAISRGARQIVEAQGFKAPTYANAYVNPQVLIDVNHSMAVMREETFGPVIGIMKVKSDDEAVALMNDSTYGLTSSIWTSDAVIAEAIGNQLVTGTVLMNRCDYADPYLAWSGVKDTGLGASLSVFGFHAVTRPASFHLRNL